jgi:hypothetical protein
MSKDRLLDAQADLQAAIEDVAVGLVQEHARRLWAILDHPEERDEELWLDGLEMAGLSLDLVDLPLSEHHQETERGIAWTLTNSTMIALARTQAAIPALRATIAVADRGADKVRQAAQELDLAELREAAVEGVTKARILTARERSSQTDPDNG